MSAFDYIRAENIERARELLQRPGAVALGGGTDLLVAVREGIVSPELVVDLRGLSSGDDLEWRSDGSLRVPATARLAQLARDTGVREQFPALAMACESVGSDALRNMSTLAGNLCQRPRCWYFRLGVPCLKNGGNGCPAVPGENQYHAILGGGPCYIVHPSDPAVALSALEAIVSVDGPRGSHVIPMREFFVLPEQRLDGETVLDTGEFVTHVDVPARSSGGSQLYLKLMQRGTWDFALASVAVVKRRDGAVRIVLGGVAPKPWCVDTSVEEDVASGALADEDIETLAERALYDARPLEKNGYKVQLAKTLLQRAMRFATSDSERTGADSF